MRLQLTRHILAGFLSIGLLYGLNAVAVTLDVETHDVLIGKLAEVRQNLTRKDSSFVPTSLRLADLLSDRARLKDMDSMTKTGEMAKDSKADRLQAIQMIEESLSILKKTDIQSIRANLQRAQLFQLVDQPKKAEDILVQIRKTNKKTDEYWTATDLLADLNFSLGRFDVAEKMYGEIQKSPKKNQFSQYRLAWCALHLGREQEAVKKLDALLSSSGLEDGLRTEASRDMAIFQARLPFKQSSIQKIQRLSGNDVEVQRSNLKLYGEELKRLGQKKESALVFLTYLQLKNPNQEETQITQTELFENLVHIQKNREALDVLQKIAQGKCEDKCADVQNRIHKTLRNWAALEAKNASPELLRAFAIFAQMEPFEQNALLFGIKVAQDANKHQVSVELLNLLIAKTRDAQVLENALQAHIQSAEKTKNKESQLAAYDLYLSRGKDSKLKNEVAVIRVQTLIAMGRHKDAETSAESLYRSSKDKEMGEMLLGIYQKSKQTEKERLLSLDLSKGNRQTEYFRNYKRLSLQLAKTRLDANMADSSDYDLLVDLSNGGSKEEKYKILSDAYLVALKIEDFERLKKTSILLLDASRGLNAKEKSLALEKRMFVADLELDFKTSAQLERQNQKGYSAANSFRLILKSRLAGTPDLALERKLLNDRRANLEQRIWILQNQLIGSQKPFALLRENSDLLRSRRELNARFALMAMANSRESEARSYLRDNAPLKRTLFGLLLERRDNLVEMTKMYRTALNTRIQFGSIKSFNRTLDERMLAMNRFEKRYAKGNRDQVLGMIAHGYMSGLHLTLAKDLEQAARQVSVPASLRKEFAQQLNHKAEELRTSVARAEGDMEKIWEQSGFEKEMAQVFEKAHPLQRKALLSEIALWKGQSYGVIQKSWSRLERAHTREDQTSLASLYQKVQKNPFRSELSKELARAEDDRGNHLLSAFISQRDRQLGGI